MLRVRFKQISGLYKSKSGKITGISFGGGNFVICVYDKTAQELRKSIDLKKAVTRIEVRLRGKAIPFEYIYELPKLIKPTKYGGELPNLFHCVYIQPFTLADKNTLTNEIKKEKLIELRTRIDAAGLDDTVKKLNKNSNFARDNKELISFQSYPHDLNKILLSNLHRFFGKRMMDFL